MVPLGCENNVWRKVSQSTRLGGKVTNSTPKWQEVCNVEVAGLVLLTGMEKSAAIHFGTGDG